MDFFVSAEIKLFRRNEMFSPRQKAFPVKACFYIRAFASMDKIEALCKVVEKEYTPLRLKSVVVINLLR